MPVSADILHNIPLFNLLDEAELTELAAHIDEDLFSPHQTIFKAGELGSEMHIVLRGKVQTFVTDPDGKQVIIAEAGPGDFVGELSLLDNEPHGSTALVLEPTQTFIIDRDDLMRLFKSKPDAALDIIAVLGKRIRSTDILLAGRTARNANTVIQDKLTFGQMLADKVAAFGGSWNFIALFGIVLVVWIFLNSVLAKPWDVYPFILLNLILSMLAALQAPVIMMSQNRQDAKDRIRSELDYNVNLKAEIEIMQLHQKLDDQRETIKELMHLNQKIDELGQIIKQPKTAE